MKHTQEQTAQLKKYALKIQLEAIHYQQSGKGLVFLELAMKNMIDEIRFYEIQAKGKGR
jgi:hypothetical protein